VQPSKVRLLTIPAYFVNFKDETTDLAPFLGASISAKVSLHGVSRTIMDDCTDSR